MPIKPDAPGLLPTADEAPSRGMASSVMVRTRMPNVPPAAEGTINRMGLEGQSCAVTGMAVAVSRPASAKKRLCVEASPKQLKN